MLPGLPAEDHSGAVSLIGGADAMPHLVFDIETVPNLGVYA